MDFRILGPLEVAEDDGPVRVRGRMEEALLALLVVNAGTAVSVDVVAEELWGDHPPPTAIKTVRSYVSRLRRRLGEAVNIETTGSGYALNTDRATIDAFRFEDLLNSAIEHRRAGFHELAASELASALDEWRGPVLAGLEDHNFARMEAARLDSRRLEALEARLASDLELGRHRQLVAELEQLVSAHPHHEAFWKHLMMALYRSDRQADALGAFRDAKAGLGEELGIEPSEELRELEEQILLQDPALLASHARENRVHNLPTSLDSFVGRVEEMDEIRPLLTDYRCVTLTGVGGSGKTRLGIEVARSIVDGYPDGARWAELATIHDPDGLAEHVLLTFGEPGSHAADPGGVLVEILRPKRFLLILDNCEHMIGPVAELTDRLLTECPDLRVLATSREAFGIAGEAVYHVPTLQVPEWGDSPDRVRDTEAALLFVDRVRTHIHDFAVDEQTAASVTTVCRKLDGIPLALELGAARMRTMTISELADRIDNRFELLIKGSRIAPPRQQTLRATIEWSYELLTPAKRTLRALGVFAGTWTLEAARAVALEHETEITIMGLVDELVDKCLVETASEDRFRLLETIRQFAFEQLVVSGEAPDVGRSHRDWYRKTAVGKDPELRGSKQVSAWTRLEQDHDNLRAAIRWSLDNGEPDGALELVAALGYFWMVRGYWREAWRWLERVLAAQDGSPLARSEAITGEAITEVIRVNYGAVKELLGEAVVVFEEMSVPASHARASLLQAVGDSLSGADNAHELLQQVYDSAIASDDSWSAAFVARYLADGTDSEVISLLEESYQRFLTLGDRWNAAFSMYFISGWHLSSEMYDDAEESAWKARDLAAEIGDIIWHAHATRVLGLAALRKGDHDRARKYMGEALQSLSAIGDDACSTTLNTGLASLALESGYATEAIRLIAEAIRSAIRLGSPMTGPITLWRAAEIAVAAGDARHAVRLAAVAHRELDGKTQVLSPMITNDIEAIEGQIVDSIEPGLRDEIAGEVGDLPLDETLEHALRWCDMQMTSAGAGSD
jgi:predicted ATPase/DNA-binding SARP family transcriptional activator